MEKIIPGKILTQETVKSSSSDNTYIVTLFDNCISCTCPAGGRKTFCKHMVSVIHKNLELLKNANPDFYNELILLLEMKNDKNHNIEVFKEMSAKFIYSDKGIAQQAALNSAPFKQEKKQKSDLAETVVSDIETIDIHQQFEFFDLICLAYNKSDIGFRYCEYPQNLDEFIKRNYLIPIETTNIKDFRKMDSGRKSLYFYKFSPDIQTIIRLLHKILSVKFPKIQDWDEDGIFFTERRIIDPKYL